MECRNDFRAYCESRASNSPTSQTNACSDSKQAHPGSRNPGSQTTSRLRHSGQTCSEQAGR